MIQFLNLLPALQPLRYLRITRLHLQIQSSNRVSKFTMGRRNQITAKTTEGPKTPAPGVKASKRCISTAGVTDTAALIEEHVELTALQKVERMSTSTEFEESETTIVVAKKKSRKREPDPLPCRDPWSTPGFIAELNLSKTPPPLPVPNLGYACLNTILRALKPPVFSSRDLIKRTLETKGLEYLGQLCLANSQDLARLIQWNAEHGIRFFRMSSVVWPWMGTFNAADLPQFEEIKSALAFAGELARAHDQRVTFHPSHFVKLAAPDEALVQKSISELEGHSQILDLMGYEPSPWNKINIHIGGVYGDKDSAIQRWATNFKRLSLNAQKRMTVENDDVPTSFRLQDLLKLHELIGIPLVFDFHHHKFCPGDLTEEEAFKAALKTWPAGVRPVVHWSESQLGRKPHAHSDFVKGPIYLHGLEKDVDVMIEAKMKEQALLCVRDGLPIPEVVVDIEEPGVGSDAALALRLLEED